MLHYKHVKILEIYRNLMAWTKIMWPAGRLTTLFPRVATELQCTVE